MVFHLFFLFADYLIIQFVLLLWFYFCFQTFFYVLFSKLLASRQAMFFKPPPACLIHKTRKFPLYTFSLFDTTSKLVDLVFILPRRKSIMKAVKLLAMTSTIFNWSNIWSNLTLKFKTNFIDLKKTVFKFVNRLTEICFLICKAMNKLIRSIKTCPSYDSSWSFYIRIVWFLMICLSCLRFFFWSVLI